MEKLAMEAKKVEERELIIEEEKGFSEIMKKNADEIRRDMNDKKLFDIYNPRGKKSPEKPSLQKQNSKSKKDGKLSKQSSQEKKKKAEEKEEKRVENALSMELSESTRYFVCKNGDCEGGFCLACNMPVKRSEILSHQCETDQVEMLYRRVLETLAIASSRTCPKCNFPGMKDLNCTHITCDKCSARWCYHCGRLEADVGQSGFSGHNEWNVNLPEDTDKCPMYLHYKYGDVYHGGDRREGDPARSLVAFHLKIQKEAIAHLEKAIDPDLWAKLIQKRFSNGIF